jgi:uncharacterized protein
MFRGILPKEYSFYDFFESHIELAIQTCTELANLAKEGTNIFDSIDKIKEFEHKMDKIELDCVEALHKTFITPFERTDILELIKRMDDIVDSIDKAASRIKIYDITVIRKDVQLVADILLKSTIELKDAIIGLRDIKHIDKIRQKCQRVRQLETEGDNIFKKAISDLFKETDAINVIKWKEIYERLEKAVNRCEDVANIIEGILIESA